MTERRRSIEAALRPVGGVEEIQVVGALPDTALEILGLETEARSVWIHPSVVVHIQTQRGMERGDAEFVLSNLSGTILRPDYVGSDPRKLGRFDLVRLTEPAGRPLFIAVKHVSAAAAASQTDEIWVCTGHPLPFDFLTQKRYRVNLKSVGYGTDN